MFYNTLSELLMRNAKVIREAEERLVRLWKPCVKRAYSHSLLLTRISVAEDGCSIWSGCR